MELRGRTTIVTGAGSGVGRALALEFARQGASVVCAGRRKERLDETVAMMDQPDRVGLAVATDVTDPAQVEHLVTAALERFGRIHVLFNNAGSFGAIGGLWQVDPASWWHDVTVNLRGPMLCCRAVLEHMMSHDEGILLNMTGGGGTSPLAGGSGYGCSKAALIRLTDTLAAELRRAGSSVLVFAMGPGFVRTEMTMRQVTTPEGLEWIPSSKEALDAGKDRPPEDCARSAVELLRIARPELSGRIFGTGTDFQRILADLDRIQRDDLHTLRMRR